MDLSEELTWLYLVESCNRGIARCEDNDADALADWTRLYRLLYDVDLVRSGHPQSEQPVQLREHVAQSIGRLARSPHIYGQSLQHATRRWEELHGADTCPPTGVRTFGLSFARWHDGGALLPLVLNHVRAGDIFAGDPVHVIVRAPTWLAMLLAQEDMFVYHPIGEPLPSTDDGMRLHTALVLWQTEGGIYENLDVAIRAATALAGP